MILRCPPPPTVRVVPLVTTRALREPLDYLAARRASSCSRGDVVHVPLAGRSVRGVVVEAGGAVAARGRAVASSSGSPTSRASRPVVLELCLWIAPYYGSTPARALALGAAAARAGAERHLGLGHGRPGRDGAAACAAGAAGGRPAAAGRARRARRHDAGDRAPAGARTGWSRSTRGCACRAWRRAHAAPGGADRGPDGGRRADRGPARGRRRRPAALRGHRLGQDRGLPARRRERARARAHGARAGARDRALAADRAPLRRALRRPGRRAALRALRRRAAGGARCRGGRRRARRRGRALGRLRAAAAASA